MTLKTGDQSHPSLGPCCDPSPRFLLRFHLEKVQAMIEIRWLGAAGLEIAVDGNLVLIDPYISRPGKFSVFFRRLRPSRERILAYTSRTTGRITGVICGHTHFDHALDIPDIISFAHCKVIGGRSLKTLFEISGMNPDMDVCKGNESYELEGEIKVHMIPSRHGLVMFGRVPYPGEVDPHAEIPLKASQYGLGTMFMPKIEIGGVTLMHAGSANFIESEVRGHRCDVLFMCVPGWKNVPEYTTKFVEMLAPEVIIPFHFDDFTLSIPDTGRIRTLPFTDMQGFIERIHRHNPGAVIRIPNPNEVMRF